LFLAFEKPKFAKIRVQTQNISSFLYAQLSGAGKSGATRSGADFGTHTSPTGLAPGLTNFLVLRVGTTPGVYTIQPGCAPEHPVCGPVFAGLCTGAYNVRTGLIYLKLDCS
jgi:hypothetical protein